MSFEGDFKVGSLWGMWWGYDWGVESVATSQAYDGKQSLQVRVTGQYFAIGTKHIDGLAPGSTVTIHVWYGGQGSGYICPFVQDLAFHEQWIPQEPLYLAPSEKPGWHTYSWVIPTLTLNGTGFQLEKTSPRSDFVVLLDAVTW